jgi:thioester reductase-like protein
MTRKPPTTNGSGPHDLDDPNPDEAVLITGFPSFTAARMARKVLESDPRAKVYLLSRDKFTPQAEELLASFSAAQRNRAQVITGDVCDMDLGLSGAEYRSIAGTITTIHHMAGVYYLGVERKVAARVNVDGTRGVIELARECKRLRRLCHYSTAAVSGRRKGVILEEELDEGQTFHNSYE